MPFILLGNMASSLKFELISRKIKLVFFWRDGAWYTWTFSLPSTWLQLPWWKLCDVSKADCIARDYILLSKLRSSWRFLKFCDNADEHSQTGNRKKISGSWIRKTSRENKSYDKRLETLFTPSIEHLFTQTSFYCGFDRYKVMDCIQVPLVN